VWRITVGPNTPIVTDVPGDKSDIKPSAKVFIVAVKQAGRYKVAHGGSVGTGSVFGGEVVKGE
jgi:hypothetical protein